MPSKPIDIPRIAGLQAIAGQYRAILSDVWGVVHNGVRAHTGAVDALKQFRTLHGPVVMITNAPRPWRDVQGLLRQLAIPDDTYDAIITSGDLTSSMLQAHAGEKVYHLGPARDLPMFADTRVHQVGLKDADFVLCSGLFDDDHETPEDYADLLQQMRASALMMICANPDLVVERGNRLVYCAGALAQAYEAIGGEVIYAGKPHGPIYQTALGEIAKAAGRSVDNVDVLAIGDSIRTDLAGAAGAGLGALFIAGGIHGEEHPDATRLDAAFAQAGLRPDWVMDQLAW